jgi:hypothetical protein
MNEKSNFEDKIKELEEQVKFLKTKHNKNEIENNKCIKDISKLIYEKLILNLELTEEKEKNILNTQTYITTQNHVNFFLIQVFNRNSCRQI